MITPETPLTEIAGHLGQETAAHLLEYSDHIQTAVLSQIRSIVAYWERRRIVFDPIAYSEMLSTLVGTLAPTYVELMRQKEMVAGLTSQLSAAEHLIRSLTAPEGGHQHDDVRHESP